MVFGIPSFNICIVFFSENIIGNNSCIKIIHLVWVSCDPLSDNFSWNHSEGFCNTCVSFSSYLFEISHFSLNIESVWIGVIRDSTGLLICVSLDIFRPVSLSTCFQLNILNIVLHIVNINIWGSSSVICNFEAGSSTGRFDQPGALVLYCPITWHFKSNLSISWARKLDFFKITTEILLAWAWVDCKINVNRVRIDQDEATCWRIRAIQCCATWVVRISHAALTSIRITRCNESSQTFRKDSWVSRSVRSQVFEPTSDALGTSESDIVGISRVWCWWWGGCNSRSKSWSEERLENCSFSIFH